VITRAGDQRRNNAISGAMYCYVSAHGGIQKTFGKRVFNFIQNQWVTLILTVVVPLALASIALKWEFHAQRLSGSAGVISSPSQDATMSISVGSAEFVMLSKDGVVFDDGERALLSIRHIGEKLFVTAEIRDENGNVIAEIKDNEWKHQEAPATGTTRTTL